MPPPPDIEVDMAVLGPRAAGVILMARNEMAPTNKGAGGIDPADINNKVIFVLFGLLGAAFVLVGLWFFFWAKNGGFYFKEDDWEEYKSTILRRKGPNGTLLSGATPTTQLGGGSVYKDVDEDGATTVSGLTGITGITPGASDVGGRERHRKRKEMREQKKREKQFEKERRKAAKKTGRHVGEDGVLVDEVAENEAREHLRSYRHEQAARVGGLNVDSEASEWDGGTNPADSVQSSDLLSNRQATPTRETPKALRLFKKFKSVDKSAASSEVSGTMGYHMEGRHMVQVTASSSPSAAQTENLVPAPVVESPTKARTAGGIRKVYSTADRNSHREQERIRAEARRLQEKGRQAASRRDFSWQRAEVPRLEAPPVVMTPVTEESQSMFGSERESRISWADNEDLASGIGTDIGTKSYHHPIPELTGSSVSGSGAAGEDIVEGSSVSGGSVSAATSYVDAKRKQRRAERAEKTSSYKREKRRL